MVFCAVFHGPGILVMGEDVWDGFDSKGRAWAGVVKVGEEVMRFGFGGRWWERWGLDFGRAVRLSDLWNRRRSDGLWV